MASAAGGNISMASNPSVAALSHAAAKSSQKTNGPPAACGTREIVIAERMGKQKRVAQSGKKGG